ncbi:MAG: purine-nucleoside phosphorylase [Massiliimalia sp.]|jgi:purine-nucleoside phosphorylase
MSVPTPHIEAKQGDFAKTVLMPGDPLRAKYIAETFLEDAKLVTAVRGIYGYTGTYHGKPVSVMASGMGVPSMGIYSYELFHFYNVDTIIRIGSAGALHPSLKLKDIVIAQAVSTDSSYANQYHLPGTIAPIGDFQLMVKAVEEAKKLGVRAVPGNLLCSEVFYADPEDQKPWIKMGILAVEMESAALYLNAAEAGKRALCLCTISDLPMTGESCTAEERQNSFTDMMKIALEIAE